ALISQRYAAPQKRHVAPIDVDSRRGAYSRHSNYSTAQSQGESYAETILYYRFSVTSAYRHQRRRVEAESQARPDSGLDSDHLQQHERLSLAERPDLDYDPRRQ